MMPHAMPGPRHAPRNGFFDSETAPRLPILQHIITTITNAARVEPVEYLRHRAHPLDYLDDVRPRFAYGLVWPPPVHELDEPTPWPTLGGRQMRWRTIYAHTVRGQLACVSKQACVSHVSNSSCNIRINQRRFPYGAVCVCVAMHANMTPTTRWGCQMHILGSSDVGVWAN
jgi:hypothetical protein